MKFYSLSKILSKNATYNLIIGERSNGKTYSVLKYGIEEYFKNGSQMAIVRRWGVDIQGRRASGIFSALNDNGEIEKISRGEYTFIYYWAGKFYLANKDDTGKAVYSDSDVIAYTFALSEQEHNKSISYPKVNNILFDEFITNGMYLNDEFMALMNTLSTIIRQRDNVKIFMCGNTVNKYCPYFEEMGLKHINKMEQGTIDVYRYGETKLIVAVEYCASMSKYKKSNFYFAFDNPKLQMIKTGSWELGVFPHLPQRYTPNQILFTFFIEFDGYLYQAEVINFKGGNIGLYIHIKTTPIKKDSDLVLTMDYNYKLCYNNLKGLKVIDKIKKLFAMNKVCYQNNDVGNAIANFLKGVGISGI